MKEEKKKTESENKIVVFDIDESVMTDADIDRFLAESLMKEADELEAELNQDPGLRGADVSDAMFQSIVNQLKEQGIWEEEEAVEKERITENTEDKERVEEKKQNAESEEKGQKENRTPQNLEELYAMLPEEDFRALKLGKQVEKQNIVRDARKRRRKKVFKYSGIAAAILVLVFGGSMTIEANRRLVQKAWDGMMYNLGFRVSTNYVGEEENVRSKTKEEIETMEEISKVLEVPAISLEYIPKGMKYLNYEIMEDNSEAVVFYVYQEKIFSVTIISLKLESVSYYALDNEAVLRDTVLNEQKVKVDIKETNLGLEEETYTAEIDYNDSRYILNGMISLEEMRKIAKNIIIL